MPLAIELAAARIRHLSPAQLAERLGTALDVLGTGSRAALDRQQTLRATLDWSYALLDDDERAAVRRALGVRRRLRHRGGGGGRRRRRSTSSAGSSTSRSSSPTVTASGVRYRLLETFRQYGQRAPDGPTATPPPRIAATTSRWPSCLRAAGRAGRGRRLDPPLTAEHPNLRAAIASGLRDAPEEALRLVTALHRFWLTAGTCSRGGAGATRRSTRGRRATRCARAR